MNAIIYGLGHRFSEYRDVIDINYNVVGFSDINTKYKDSFGDFFEIEDLSSRNELDEIIIITPEFSGGVLEICWFKIITFVLQNFFF